MVGVFGPKDMGAIGLRVFAKYLEVTRRLQKVYMLEPAGSHGVWGLDDYQFLSFLLGAAQLAGTPQKEREKNENMKKEKKRKKKGGGWTTGKIRAGAC